MNNDAKLAAFFAAAEPPARDPAFQAELMARLARRRLRRDLGVLAAASAAGGWLLATAWPALAPALEALGEGLAPAAAALALTMGLSLMLTGRLFFGAGDRT
ncbi:MAG: hypothetical protein ACK41C_18290 [Phenylobacterium sp.]|uniref:hypothetical protein n=1 Tax=Phenylobacterium sp. TaxID=1871053 RepID=UPI00391C39AE